MSESRKQPDKNPADGPAETAAEYVEVYVAPEDMQDTARQLLDAAGEDQGRIERVETISGGFRVPRDIADAAGVSPFDDTAVDPARTGTQAARESSSNVVSGDAVIAAEIESGAASPAAVGAVFASNSPTGEDIVGEGEGQQGGEQGGQGEAQSAPGPEQQEPEQAPTQEQPAEPQQQQPEQPTKPEEQAEPETGSAPTGKSRRSRG